MNRSALICSLVFCSVFASAQLFPPAGYPQNEFRNPLGIPISLAANFGELRSNHYHMGLDIRTAHRENLPVYAAADGYIYRIKIEPFGFGQAIYVRHTNGFVTLYAHLNGFYPVLAAWVQQKQYQLERWNISVELPPNLLRVKKGDVIAYSGNMGGSQGPHLHFEIRTYPDDVNLNPMLFGFSIADNTPPVFRGMSVYDRNRSFYEQPGTFVPVKGSGAKYAIGFPVLILKTPNPGFGVAGFDTQSGSKNPNGIFQAVIYDNGNVVSGFQMDSISYNDTRGINAHIDYPTRARGGPYYQLLFKMPGYNHSIYREANADGKIHLEDGKLHEIRIELTDAYGNVSKLIFKARYRPDEEVHAIPPIDKLRMGKVIQNNPPAFPGKMFYPGMVDGFEGADAAFYLGEKCLYDSVHLVYQEMAVQEQNIVSGLHHFGSMEIPLADTMTVRIRLTKAGVAKDRVLMQWADGADFDVKKPVWLGDWATATFKSFGNFSLVTDTIPPNIRFPGVVENANLQRSSRIAVLVQDNYKKIRNFRATLDGRWLLFTNDKARAFIYNFDQHCLPGKHELKIYAEDEAGNASEAVMHFTR